MTPLSLTTQQIDTLASRIARHALAPSTLKKMAIRRFRILANAHDIDPNIILHWTYDEIAREIEDTFVSLEPVGIVIDGTCIDTTHTRLLETTHA